MRQANFRIYRKILTILLVLFLSASAYAQQITVKGTVKDQTGEPAIGANVLIKELLTESLQMWMESSSCQLIKMPYWL